MKKIRIRTIVEIPPGRTAKLFRKYLREIKFIPIEKVLNRAKKISTRKN